MRKRFFYLLSALFLLTTGVEAQNEGKCDLNGDGYVDVSDLAFVINIMRSAGGVFNVVTGIELSSNELTLEEPATSQLTYTVTPSNATNPNVTWSSSNESVATVNSTGLVVTTGADGTTMITCTATDGSGVSATCTVTVLLRHEYVDLGLPSGTLWATTNIGADSPEDYGDYFAWGETDGYDSGKTTFDWSNYKYCKGSETTLTKYCNKSDYGYNGFTDYNNELELADDAAYVNWGKAWRMPSNQEMRELINNCTFQETTLNGVSGGRFIGPNGNSIFLPYGGYQAEALHNNGSWGQYWSRFLNSGRGALILDLINNECYMSARERCTGHSIRPVRLTE